MGITLTGKTVKTTYKGLIKTTDNEALSAGVTVGLSDGFGNETDLKVATDKTSVSNLEVANQIELGTSNAAIDAGGDDLAITKGYLAQEISLLPFLQLGYQLVSNITEFNQLVVGNSPNKNWLISGNVVLDGNKTLPTNTRLTFSNGIISGAFTLTGDNSTIECGLMQSFDTDVSFDGDWNNREVHLEWWGVGIDGTVAASEAIEKASTLGEKVLFPETVLLDRTVVLSQDTYLQGVDGITTIISSQAGSLFESSSNILTIKGFKYTAGASNASTFLDVVADASYLDVSGNEFIGRVDNVTNYLVEVSSSVGSPLTIKNINVNRNVTENATIFYADFFNSDDILFEENVSKYTPRFMFRVNPPLTSVSVVKRLIIKNNECYDMNGNMVLKEATARFAQVKSLYCEIEGNTLDGAESTQGLTAAANFAYIKQGTYKIFGNTVKNIKTVDSVSIIDNKGTGGKIAGSTVEIYNNVFDQELVSFAETPESIIRVNEADNVSAYSNKFFNLKCFAFRLNHSVDTGDYPNNCSFYDNEIYNIDFPVPIQVTQNIKGTSIYNNIIHDISNTTAIAINLRTENRIVDIYQSFQNGNDLDNVLIQNNTVYNSIGNCFMASLWLNDSNLTITSAIRNVKIIGNSIVKGNGTGHIVKTTGTQSEIDALVGIDIFNNSGFSGMFEQSGGTPISGIRIQNNLLT